MKSTAEGTVRIDMAVNIVWAESVWLGAFSDGGFCDDADMVVKRKRRFLCWVNCYTGVLFKNDSAPCC